MTIVRVVQRWSYYEGFTVCMYSMLLTMYMCVFLLEVLNIAVLGTSKLKAVGS